MKLEIVDIRGPAVELDGDTFVLEETRTYRLHASDVRGVWLDAQQLLAGPSGYYEFSLGHYVGDLALRISTNDGGDVHRLRVRPRADKLPPTLWVKLLEELEAGLAGLSVGLMGPTQGAVGTSGAAAPLLVSALLPLVPMFMTILRTILEDPRRVDRDHPLERKLHECRRIDSSTLAWISRHPEVGRWLDGWQAAELVGQPPLVPIHAPISTLDHPVNRHVAWLTNRVINRLFEVADELDKHAKRIDESVWCRSRAARARTAAIHIGQLRDRSWLRTLRPEPASGAAFLVIADDPTYARFQRFARRFCAPAFDLRASDQDPGAPVRPSFSIYELWCLFALRQHLEAALPQWSWSQHNLDDLLTLTGSGSGATIKAHRGDQHLRIDFNPTFKSWYCRGAAPRHSLSGERRPDFVITHDGGPHGNRWILLDAKYRAGRENLAKALTSVHIYRDALIDENRGGKCAGAMLLAPSACDVPEWFDAAWQRTQGLGITALAPDMRAPALTAWICETLGLS